jgi:hypothetical protein
MNKRLFGIGFGVSLALIAVCIWYAFASPVSRSVLDSFDPAYRGWYVHQPAPYNLCLLAFAVLNLPAMLLFWPLFFAVEAATLSAAGRAAVSFALLIALSAGWWTILARWSARRAAKLVRPQS